MSNTIAILGCGWLGLPLAQHLIAEGYQVNGATTSTTKLTYLKEQGIHPFLISITEQQINGPIDDFLKHAEVLVINIPPRLKGTIIESYIDKMKLVLEAILRSDIKNVLFVSSTSVYGDLSGTVTEATIPRPNTESGRQLLATEQLFLDALDINTTIVRFAGLIGLDRHPVHFLAKKQSLTNGNDPVNLIHLNDCIAIISAVIKKQWWNEIFNAVYPDHPLKKEYYPQEAEKKGLKLPEYDDVTMAMGKKIEPNWLLDVKKYRFNTPIQS